MLTSSLGGFSMVFWHPPKSKDLLVTLAGDSKLAVNMASGVWDACLC